MRPSQMAAHSRYPSCTWKAPARLRGKPTGTIAGSPAALWAAATRPARPCCTTANPLGGPPSLQTPQGGRKPSMPTPYAPPRPSATFTSTTLATRPCPLASRSATNPTAAASYHRCRGTLCALPCPTSSRYTCPVASIRAAGPEAARTPASTARRSPRSAAAASASRRCNLSLLRKSLYPFSCPHLLMWCDHITVQAQPWRQQLDQEKWYDRW